MRRRRFEHLLVELSVALGRVVPRYPLWLFLRECDCDPENLGRDAAISFCDHGLDSFLADHGWPTLTPRLRRRLRRAVARFDPSRPTPDQTLERLTTGRI